MNDVKELNENPRWKISEIKNDVSEIKSKMEEMYTALMGSSLSRDGGLIARIIDTEEQVKKLGERIAEVEKKEDKRTLYISIIIGILSALLGYIISAFITHFLNRK